MTVFLLAMTLPASGQETIDATLARIHRDYTTYVKNGDVGGLVVLDWALRSIFRRPLENFFRPVKDTAEYAEIGVATNHWAESLIYEGKLLWVAHQINPKSSYRESTLYSTVWVEEAQWAGEAYSFPSIPAAEAYLKEFPAGPFADILSLKLAYFYEDLYKVIQDELNREARDFKYDCFASYLTKQPLAEQLASARSEGLKYYRLAPLARSRDESAAQAFANMTAGKPDQYGWHYCPD
jgi:hypothetical protein